MALLDQTQKEYYEGDNYGNYQFVALSDIIDQFMVVYVGEDKIIQKAKRIDVAFHAQRALAELSFDTFKSVKSQEITLPPSLTMILPQDYVNYTKISSVDGSGIKHPLYPTTNTSNPTPILQNSDGEYKLEIKATLTSGSVNIELDDIHPNVARRMRVTGPSIPENMFIYIHDDTVAGDKSVIVLRDLNNNIFTPSANTTEVLTFSNENGTLLNELEDGVSIMGGTSTTGFDTTAGSNILTLEPSSTQDISEIKEGMLAFSFSTDIVPENTKVIQIDTTNNVVFLSNPVVLGAPNVGFMFVGNNSNSTTWNNYKNHKPKENTLKDYDYDDQIYEQNVGQRYGLSPQHAQINGSYFIDDNRGLIYFSSNLSGQNIVLDYISDGLGTENEMKVHKFAEEAMYRSIAYGLVAGSRYLQPLVPRYKKEKFAAVRQAKLRLSNLKLTELVQVMRNKSKHIKH
jgi:hypothetical protein